MSTKVDKVGWNGQCHMGISHNTLILSQGCGSLTSTKEALTPFEETYLAGACEQVSRYLLRQIEFMSFCKVMCHLLEEWLKQFLVRITFLLLEGLKTEELKFSFLFSLSS